MPIVTLKNQRSYYAPKDHPIKEGLKDFDYAIQNGINKGQAKSQKSSLEINKNDLYYRQFLNNRNVREFSFKGVSLEISREVATHIANPQQLGIDLLVLSLVFFLYKKVKKKNRAHT